MQPQHTPALLEAIDAAQQAASLATEAVRAAHRRAIYDCPLSEIILSRALNDAVELDRSLAGLNLAVTMGGGAK
jgi:type II secretory pathway component HofQ